MPSARPTWLEITGDLHDPLNVEEVASCIGRVGLAAELIDVTGRLGGSATLIEAPGSRLFFCEERPGFFAQLLRRQWNVCPPESHPER